MSVDLERIGRRIAEERKVIRKVSQEKMAEDLGLYQADISNLERARKGSGITDLLRLDAIASYFDISLESLLFGSGKENKMIHYYGEKMQIRQFSDKKKISKKHCKLLAQLTDNTEEAVLNSTRSFVCGPYYIHMLTELQSEIGQGPDGKACTTFVLHKLHFYVLLDDELIACMTADYTQVAQFIYEPQFRKIQTIIQPDVLDVTDALRTMNPYYPLAVFSEDLDETKEFQKAMYSRMDELWKISTEAVMFIESIYVLEDCRKQGICRLLIDVLRKMVGDCTIWMNMEPTAGEELTDFTPYFPSYTQAEIGQLSQNAAIAERLGFTVDPDCWHGQVEKVDKNGNITYQTVEYRKCAYLLSEGMREITKNDGDLVAIGRARQKLAQAKEENPRPSGVTDLRMKIIDGKRVAELRTADRGEVRYSFYVLSGDGSTYFAASHHSILMQGFDVDIIEDCEWFEEKPDSPYYNDWKLMYFMMPPCDGEVDENIENEL